MLGRGAMRRELRRKGVRVRRLVWATLIAFLLGTVILQPSARAAVIDLTYEGASGSANGALFYQFNEIPTGTGRVNTFLRIQGFGEQHGYNTDGTVEYDTMASFTHSDKRPAHRKYWRDRLPGTLLGYQSRR